jgi:hypothetical protein
MSADMQVPAGIARPADPEGLVDNSTLSELTRNVHVISTHYVCFFYLLAE